MVTNIWKTAVSGVSLVDNIMILIINIFAALWRLVGNCCRDSILAGKMKNQHVKAATQLVWFVSLGKGLQL